MMLAQEAANLVAAELSIGATHKEALTSSVTTSWGVDWNPDYIARDLIQNFFDANRGQVEEIKVTQGKSSVRINAPAEYDLKRLYFVGSEKGQDDIGQYGEGFKVAAVCILRHHGTAILAASGKNAVVISLGEPAIAGTTMYPLIYHYFELNSAFEGNALFIVGAWKELISALECGLNHFFYDGNPLLGELVVSTGNNFKVFRSTCNTTGYIFYNNLRRGTMPYFPLVLVLNSGGKRLENKIAQDRDRKAFEESILKTFYTSCAEKIYGAKHLETLLAEAKIYSWKNGKGHPFLEALSRKSHPSWFSEESRQQIFGNDYFALSPSWKRRENEFHVEILEKEWKNAGKIALPEYFSAFGLNDAISVIETRAKKSLDEAKAKGISSPTKLESDAIALLTKVSVAYAAKLNGWFQAKNIRYSVAIAENLLGEFKAGLSYRSVEVYMAASIFEGDFSLALATFLHEHAHVFGNDGSREFTDALTEIIENVIRHRDGIGAYEKKWVTFVDKIRAERVHEKSKYATGQGDVYDVVSSMSDEERTKLLKQIPRAAIEAALLRGKPTL